MVFLSLFLISFLRLSLNCFWLNFDLITSERKGRESKVVSYRTWQKDTFWKISVENYYCCPSVRLHEQKTIKKTSTNNLILTNLQQKIAKFHKKVKLSDNSPKYSSFYIILEKYSRYELEDPIKINVRNFLVFYLSFDILESHFQKN